ncbi:MAG: hypothetical protein IJ824_05265 [Alphaproteobacteria bacterium]|nr:hypothetical protein [Alphaproteobacteria bacterium]
MESKYLKQSVALHAVAILLLWVDLPNFRQEELTIGQTPIIVDLSEVRIDEITNLPSKAEFGDENRQAMVEEHKNVEQYTKEASEPEEASEAEPEEVKDDYLEAPTPVPDKKPEKKPDQKPTPKPTPKQPPRPSMKPKPKPKPQPKKPDNKKPEEKGKLHSSALKSLMQEIDDSKNLDIGDKTQSAMIKNGTEVKHTGIDGGNSKGSYLNDLTISETDAIASLLRQNWNLDPGAMGMDGLRVEIRVHLSREGMIQKIEFVDQHRFNTDPSYRAVAESAQRAIIATQKAFADVFAAKYANHYEVWKTLRLVFDPLDKGVR